MTDAEKAAAEVKSTAELAPIVEGVQKIAESVTASEKRVTEKVDELDKKQERGIEDLAAKTNKTVESMIERIDRLAKGSTVLGKLVNVEYNDDGLKEVLSPETKKSMRQVEMLCNSLPEQAKNAKEPVNYAAMYEWWKGSTMIQVPGKFEIMANVGQHAEHTAKAFKALQDKAASEWQTKADIAEDVAGTGGNLVPTMVEADVARLMGDAGKLWPLCRQLPMQTKTHSIPSEDTALTVAWAIEAAALTQQDPTWAQVDITADKLYGRAKMSVEVVQDSSVGLLAWLLRVFSEKMARELDKQVVLGDGTLPELLGVRNGTGINALTSGTAAGRSLSWSLLVQTFTGASEQSARDDAVWIMSPAGYALALGLVDSNGMPIVHFGATATQGAPAGTILGRPIIVSAALGGASTLDDGTNTEILFGSLSTFTAGTRMGMSWDVTDQVGWANFQMDARLVGRFGGRVTVPAAWTYLGFLTYP